MLSYVNVEFVPRYNSQYNENILQRVPCEVRGSYGTPVSLLQSILFVFVNGDVSFLPVANTRKTPDLQHVIKSMDCCGFLTVFF